MTLEGADKLRARLRAIGQTQVLLRDIQGHGVREAKILVPHRTRNLSRTIRPGRVTADYAEIVAGGQRDVGYAAFVERGTRPHIIRPRTKKALAFASQGITTERFGPKAKLKFTLAGRLSAGSVRRFGNAAFVVVKSVHHPGTRAQPYLVPGFQKAVKDAGITTIVKLWDGAA